ncbi:hypothetical protein NPX13_g9828 [Xylaria arbuscula]|uniref:Uncharacterized protein n=1 Tax=Xylaria arbuscula TaxID=114810 RepID=A0A9W8TIN5_9PEZI|nr:hypothetical protein NPX13_g9828 [Xylaria arbuscula]
MASATTHSPSPTETAQTKPHPSPEKFLRKHRSTCTIVFFFLFFLITPWVFVVVLNFRPIGDEIHQTTYSGMVNSWDDVSGNINGVMVSTLNGLARASKVFFLVCAVLTYPVLSMVLDHAAVATVQPDISMRWCVPGNYTTSSWSDSRSREDISEDMFIDVFVPTGAYDEGESVQSFTTHCSANTTRGYFELPNFHNDLTHGPLLDNFTIHDRYSTTYNDIPYDEILHTLPYMSNYPYNTSDQLAPGPLTTTMLSMFGNESWILPLQGITNNTSTATLNTIYRDMCIGGIPFINWDYERGFAAAGSGCVVTDGGVSEPLIHIKKHVYTWFNYFGDTDGVSVQVPATSTRLASYTPPPEQKCSSRAFLSPPSSSYRSSSASRPSQSSA